MKAAHLSIGQEHPATAAAAAPAKFPWRLCQMANKTGLTWVNSPRQSRRGFGNFTRIFGLDSVAVYGQHINSNVAYIKSNKNLQ